MFYALPVLLFIRVCFVMRENINFLKDWPIIYVILKNICKSLGLRHQICQFNDWRHSQPFKKHDFPGSSVKHLSTVFDSDFDYQKFFWLRRSVSFETRCDKGDKVQYE